METLTVPGSDIEVSRLVLGTMTIGSRVGPEEAGTLVATAREAGITMLDTANSYNAGESERILGEVIAPFRDQVQVASKVFNPVGDGPDDRGLSRPAVRKALEATLRRLRTDHLDVYYLHAPDPETPIEETLGAMQEAVDAGLVREVGVSNYAAWQIAEIRALQEREDRPPVHISQPGYNLLWRRIEDEYAACSRRFDLFNIVYNPLAGGLLTGKHRDLEHPDPDTRFGGGELSGRYLDRYWNPEQFAAVGELRRIADEAGLTLPALAFRWLLGREVVDAVLLGASSTEQLRQNLAAADGPPLSPDVVAACDTVWEGLRGVAPRYNR